MRCHSEELRIAKKRAALEKACGHKVFVISGVSGEGVDTVLRAMAKEIAKQRSRSNRSQGDAKREWAP